jgi:hypothetical protein
VRALAAVLAALCACGGGSGTAHAPVDPSLDLSIVVPDTMKRVEVDFVIVVRSEVFADAAAFAADQVAHNRSTHTSRARGSGTARSAAASRSRARRSSRSTRRPRRTSS